jgi:hypothetical protein
MTDLDALRVHAQALHLHGLVAHWSEVATEAWVAPLLDWEERQRATCGLERDSGPPISAASSRCVTSTGTGPSAATAQPSRR